LRSKEVHELPGLAMTRNMTWTAKQKGFFNFDVLFHFTYAALAEIPDLFEDAVLVQPIFLKPNCLFKLIRFSEKRCVFTISWCRSELRLKEEVLTVSVCWFLQVRV
jgi:hypothetical protein